MSALEAITRVGLAAWVRESGELWETPTVLGVLGEDLQLVEIEASSRERMLEELVDDFDADDPSLRIELVFFGDAGGFFASSLSFLEHWPKTTAEVPADVFIDEHYKAAFVQTGDAILVSVRHARRPSDGPPRRRLRFRSSTYEQALSDLAREARRLRDDLIAIAERRAPQKVPSLRAALERWPA